MTTVQKYTIRKKKKSIYITANINLNNKIHFITTKQSLRTTATICLRWIVIHTLQRRHEHSLSTKCDRKNFYVIQGYRITHIQQ